MRQRLFLLLTLPNLLLSSCGSSTPTSDDSSSKDDGKGDNPTTIVTPTENTPESTPSETPSEVTPSESTPSQSTPSSSEATPSEATSSLTPSLSETSQNDDEDFNDKTVNFYKSNDVTEYTLRFYESLPNVPYVELSDFVSTFYAKEVEKSVSEGIYTFTSGKQYIEVDPNHDTLTFSNINYFSSIDSLLIKDRKVYYDYKEIFGEDEFFPVTLNLSNYNIDTKLSTFEVYLPLATLSDCFSWVEGVHIAYNESDIYFIDDYQTIYADALIENYPNYYSIIDGDTQREEDLIEFNYNEICFSYDNLNGHPETVNVGRDLVVSKGLDGLLSETYPDLKDLLLSTDRSNYLLGQYLLFDILLYDGGHAGAKKSDTVNVDLYSDFVDSHQNIKDLYNAVLTRNNAKYSANISSRVARNNIFGYSDVYYSEYFDEESIGYIGFLSFGIDYDGWDKYYNGLAEKPNDCMVYILNCLNLFKSQGIKNVVLDLTYNGGGDTGVLGALMCLLTKSVNYGDVMDQVHNSPMHMRYDFDFNFDGVFNAQDYAAIDYDFNYAIMTSYYSFSCANALPMYAKDRGIMIIGDKSGGGSCCVGNMTTADGIPVRTSSSYRLVDKNYAEHDLGVEVDAQLVNGNDYSGLFNAADVSSKITSFYAK